jgi:serine/threonine-protein kinase
VLAALAAAHRAGVVHRDLKPANIMITRRDFVKVMDFGLARDDRSRPVRQRGPVGTPGYWAPEQARGELTTAASDVYALGLLMLEVLTGPLRSHSPRSRLAQVARPFRPVIARCLASRPEDRFASAAEVETRLRRMARARRRRRAQVAWLAPAAIGVAALAATLLVMRRQRAAPPPAALPAASAPAESAPPGPVTAPARH